MQEQERYLQDQLALSLLRSEIAPIVDGSGKVLLDSAVFCRRYLETVLDVRELRGHSGGGGVTIVMFGVVVVDRVEDGLKVPLKGGWVTERRGR